MISTHTPLAGRDQWRNLALTSCRISTHTPLAGRDGLFPTDSNDKTISTHTPLAGRDEYSQAVPDLHPYFYSHAPRGARPVLLCLLKSLIDFYSHAPRGARRTC